MNDPDLIIQLVGVLLSLMCLLFAIRAGKRRRLVDDLPTTKTTGVFIGLVELKGTAEAERPLVSYLAERPCVYHAWGIDEHWSRTVTETYTDSQGHTRTRIRHESGWQTVASGGEQIPFYLQDDCGVVRVQPEKASIEPLAVFDETCGPLNPLYYGKGPPHAVSHSDYRRRFHESAIPLHIPIYVMGQAREREDVVAPEIAHDKDAPMFLISTRTEAQVAAGFRTTYWMLGILGLILCVAGWIAADYARAENSPVRFTASETLPYETAENIPSHWSAADNIATYVLAGLGYVAAWILGWVWMAFNSLIGLRQRVRQAWSNVDVQLQRRNDLIPNLVATVQGLRDHERELQTELAHLRSQLTATAPGQPGPDPEGCLPHLRAVVERYPELKTNEAFLQLQQDLSETEQRIALAREYFNDIAAFYNARLEIIPDHYLATLARLRPQPFIAATNFERAPVEVNLAT